MVSYARIIDLTVFTCMPSARDTSSGVFLWTEISWCMCAALAYVAHLFFIRTW